tara:strand:+ start:18 stop:161 length:144 start_codon:yes stop_codon:yes gene_type:complete
VVVKHGKDARTSVQGQEDLSVMMGHTVKKQRPLEEGGIVNVGRFAKG